LFYRTLLPARGFSGDYNEYFGMHIDVESLVYLMLANDMIKTFFPSAITVAEVFASFAPLLCSDHVNTDLFDELQCHAAL